MNTTLKTLLITSVLSTPSIFGASAAPSVGSELSMEVCQSHYPASREVERLSGGELTTVPSRIKQLESLEIIFHTRPVMRIIDSFLGKEALWKLNRKYNKVCQFYLGIGLKNTLENSLSRFGFSMSDKESLLQWMQKNFINIDDNGQSNSDEVPVGSNAFLGMKAFNEVFTRVMNGSEHQNLLSIMQVFSECVQMYNIFQFQPKSAQRDIVRSKTLQSAADRQDLGTLFMYADEGSEEAQQYIAIGRAYGEFGFGESAARRVKTIFDEDEDDLGQIQHIQLEELAERGWPAARELLALGYLEGKEGFDPERKQLEDLAERGWHSAQHLLVEGYAFCRYGIAKDLEKLIACAKSGWPKAQKYVVQGYAEGWYGIDQDPDKLLECAKKFEWPDAQDLVAEGYAEGWYGIDQDPNKLLECAYELGWPRAQGLVALGYAWDGDGIAPDPIKLIECAKKFEWPDAQRLVAEGYVEGWYGIAQDPKTLEECAYELGWPRAQELVALGYAGWNGIAPDPIKLLECAYELGWPKAQEYVVMGYADGMYGFPSDPTLGRLFQIYFNLKNKGRL